MKGADQQFGGLAYGTLSIFLAVPIHKDTYERDIEEALDEFGLSFPRLQNLEKIYFDESPALKGLIVRIYVEMVHFAQECIDYYCKSSAGTSSEMKSPFLKTIYIYIYIYIMPHM